LTAVQKKNCPLPYKMWDLINHVTYFGSHDLGYDTNFGAVQIGAGKLFAKKSDAENLVIFN
jgi:bifunctional N-acetylglucosamine-1-phosphate-uridyltransferase/glucosamine-1-phosphate-acetyltransferase GlmU-like protein